MLCDKYNFPKENIITDTNSISNFIKALKDNFDLKLKFDQFN